MAGIHEVFHARFVEHMYPRHTHDAWTVFVVDQGAIVYDLERRRRGAVGAAVTLLPPHVVHDGRAATSDGFRKRVLYVGTELLPEALVGRAVEEPDLADPALVRAVDRLHAILEDADEAFEAETRAIVVADRVRRHLGDAPAAESDVPERRLAEALRDLLETHGREAFTLRDASAILHASPAHLIRCFTRAFGLPPHRYLVSWRIGQARRLLLDGAPIAAAAVDAGFHDQAHLTRHFRRHVGTTPGRYATGRP